MRTIDDLLSSTNSPLWSLRCTQAEYTTLCKEVRAAARLNKAPDTRYARLWVLAAAETIRRNYRGGPWSWDIVREALGADLPPDKIEVGLRAWGRVVRQGQDGSHLRLSSLVCEGGLANHLLAHEASVIRGWSAGVLRDLRELGLQGDESVGDLTALAARRARGFTQSYLRDPGVHELIARLLGALWSLRVRLGEFPKEGLIPWLYGRDQDWRSRLPLDLEDKVAQKLLIDLLGEVETVARPVARPLVRTWLQNDRIEREISLPRTLGRDQLAEIFGVKDTLPRRMQLTLVHDGHRQPLAQLEQVNDDWRCTATPRWVPGVEEIRVELEGGFGRGLPAVGLAGAAPLPDLPWVFARERERWRLVGVGSVRHPAQCLRVALPAGCAFADANPIGTVEDRVLIEIQGEGRILRSTEVFRVRTGETQDEDAGELVLKGERFRWAREGEEVFLGAPEVYLMTEEGSCRRIPQEQLRVREVDQWRSWPPTNGGRARVRWVKGGEVRAERSFVYLPAGLNIQAREVNADGGLITLNPRGISPAAVDAKGFTARPDQGGLRLQTHAGGQPPARVNLRLLLPAGQDVQVLYPYPCERDAFFDRQYKPVDGTVGLEELAGLRAEARGAKGHPAISLQLDGGGPQLTRRFSGAEDGLYLMDLWDLRADIAELFSATDDHDAVVALEIIWLGVPPRQKRRLRVRRYSRRIEPNKEEHFVRVTPDLPEEAQIEVTARRFVAPAEEIMLTRLRPGWRWLFEPERAGSWLITARDGFVPIARPVAWFVPGDDGAQGALAMSMRIADEAGRKTAMLAALEEIAAGRGSEEDMLLLEQSVALLDHADASALDVVRALAAVPKLAALLAVRALDSDELRRLWEGLECLPFLWELVPLSAWRSALDALHTELSEALPNRPDRVWSSIGLAADRVNARLPAFDVVYQPWRVSKGQAKTRADMVEIAREQPAFMQESLKECSSTLCSRNRELQWPTLPQPTPTRLECFFKGLRLPDPDRQLRAAYWPVQLAPAAAAACSLRDYSCSSEQVRMLRQLRAFDREWFDSAYPLILSVLSAHKPVVFR